MTRTGPSAGQGVRANCVAPGAVFTPHHLRATTAEERAARIELSRSPRPGSADDIAAMVIHLLSDDGAWVQGQVDGGSFFRA